MRRAWSLLTRLLRPGIMLVETSGPPKFPWSLLCPFAHVHATPAGRAFLTIRETPVLPPLIQLRGLRRQYYRGSVAWLPNSLSTLRGAGYPYPTQDSLPAAGQALPDGTFTRKGSAERFPSQLLIDFPLSRASWRNERLPQWRAARFPADGFEVMDPEKAAGLGSLNVVRRAGGGPDRGLAASGVTVTWCAGPPSCGAHDGGIRRRDLLRCSLSEGDLRIADAGRASRSGSPRRRPRCPLFRQQM